MEQVNVEKFVDLLGFEDKYEIEIDYPHTIRRKADKYVISESINSNGYARVNLYGFSFNKHRLIALQFIHNDDPVNKIDCDHINHKRDDNRISNLRWVSHKDNMRNRTSHKGIVYNYVDDISDESIKIKDYGDHLFEDYYYYHDDESNEDFFYYYNGSQYRVLHINEMKNGSLFVYMIDINDVRVRVYLSRFKKLYGLI